MLFLCIFLVLYSVAYCEFLVCSLQFSPCVLTPEEIKGPYYVPYHLIPKDIREGKPGLRLNLSLIRHRPYIM